MMMVDKAFVDTNVLLRGLLTEMDNHEACDALLKRYWSQGTELWISGQVIREFIVQATHPRTMKDRLTISEVIDEVQRIKRLFVVADDTVAVRDQLLDLLAQFPSEGRQVHDANIAATMLANGIDTLLTINTVDFKRYASRIGLVSP
jgi:predicted nucleic acid-binding protein